MIVSGIWQIKDDSAMRSILNPALLGLNISGTNLLLPPLLDKIKEENTASNFDKCILFSNSDSLYNSSSVSFEVSQYLSGFADAPIFNCVNLLNSSSISVPYQTIETKTYYGSGYYLNQLSSASHGLSFETNESENININVSVDGGTGTLLEFKEVNPIKNDPNKPLFYLGETNGTNSYNFNISATFKGVKDPIEKSMNIVFENNKISEPLIPSLLANEDLNIMLAYSSYDTLAIVNLAKEYKLLCDYTAFIALEPNDTLHYMYKPFDESGMTAVAEDDSQQKDTVIVQVYPNPFNSQTIVKFKLNEFSKVSVTVYNLLGQKIIDLADDQMPSGDYSFRWNGKNAYGSSISSGIYLLRTYVEGIASGKKNISTNKLIYLNFKKQYINRNGLNFITKS